MFWNTIKAHFQTIQVWLWYSSNQFKNFANVPLYSTAKTAKTVKQTRISLSLRWRIYLPLIDMSATPKSKSIVFKPDKNIYSCTFVFCWKDRETNKDFYQALNWGIIFSVLIWGQLQNQNPTIRWVYLIELSWMSFTQHHPNSVSICFIYIWRQNMVLRYIT